MSKQRKEQRENYHGEEMIGESKRGVAKPAFVIATTCSL
jgi:hypothetical protein